METDLIMSNSILYRCTQKYYDQQLASYSVGYGQVVYLMMIYENEGITMKDLAVKGSFDKGTITKAISKLELLGYVYLLDNPQDKRSKLLYTTDEAKDLITKMYLIRKEWFQHLTGGLDQNKNKEFSDMMTEIVKRAQNYTDINIKTHFYQMDKLSLSSYSGYTACTLYTGGCNMKCPFCKYSHLVFLDESTKEIENEEIYQYLSKRKNMIEAICITGGEPLIHEGIIETIRELKEMGFYIKLETNGTFPDRLKILINDHLLDYVALDIKNSSDLYNQTSGMEGIKLASVSESINYLMKGYVSCEFTSTIVREFHTKESIESIGKWLQGAERFYLQYLDVNAHCINPHLHPEDEGIMKEYQKILEKYIKYVGIRNR
ncbi:radical SAM protein [Eggerthia catenaformis]|uniref:anaerobic ribonucleoside-triphosphate reductase activating protein n=1 Tax=Eggerthia catenaformis TaxID=31973 RepID=UPI00047D89A3|nr:anaerobic ribonucleoside-triphosphate reductase activating protein [Eggerthia catenaformis]OUC50718.1 radical SAM protein [Eggerthia catenaformis]